SLVSLEVVHGGNDVAPLSYRYMAEIRRRLRAGNYSDSLNSEFQSAAGELAGTAAWMAHDSNDQELARQLSFESLHYSRLAGDRTIELLTLSNLCYINFFAGHPRETLTIARQVLGTPLANWQQVMFSMRVSRALAQLGAKSEAIQAAERAASDFL